MAHPEHGCSNDTNTSETAVRAMGAIIPYRRAPLYKSFVELLRFSQIFTKKRNIVQYAGRRSVHDTSMTGKECVLRTYRHEKLDTIPWVPFAGVHVGKLTGYTATEVLADAEKLLESLRESHRIYRPDGQPVVFDLQLEAEVLGAELLWADTGPPTVASHPLAATKDIPDRLPTASDGRYPIVLDVMKRFSAEVGDTTALFGLLCGPFTLASHLRGMDLFMDMFDDPEYVKRLVAYCNRVAMRVAELYIEAGMDIVATVDPLVSQISPEHFTEFLTEPFTEFFTFLRERNVISSFFVCGDAGKNIEVMCGTAPDGISIDENIPFATAKAITDRHNITLGGNLPLTTVMLLGNQQDNMKAVIDQIDSVAAGNMIISPGCDMPYDTPIENVVAVEQAVHRTDQTREMIANYERVDDDIEVELPDYAALTRPLVEVFTLDSETCAACTYMFGAALDVKKTSAIEIDVVEYKYTKRENIARCKAMGVKQLPSIYINGKLAYSSVIPNRDELARAITAAAQ